MAMPMPTMAWVAPFERVFHRCVDVWESFREVCLSSRGRVKCLLMEAGPGIDLLVAEKVMGLCAHLWQFDEGEDDLASDNTKICTKCGERAWGLRYHTNGQPDVRPYSTDIATAWQVVEKLLTITPQGGDIHIEKLGGSDWKVGCCFTKAEGGWDGWIEGATAPLAICRAALTAVGAEVPAGG